MVSKGVLPKNTEKNYLCALRAFQKWVKERNAACSKEDVLKSNNAEILAKWLSLFVLEVRRKDSGKYPLATIHMLLCGLQRIMRRSNANPFVTFEKKDVHFHSYDITRYCVKKTMGTSCIHCLHVCIHCQHVGIHCLHYYMGIVATGGAFEVWTTMIQVYM